MVESNFGYSADVSVMGEFEQKFVVVVFVSEFEWTVGESHDQSFIVDGEMGDLFFADFDWSDRAVFVPIDFVEMAE